jgi:hypothetical protein
MNSTRKAAFTTGILLIIATLAAVVAPVVAPSLGGSGYLTGIGQHPGRLAIGALLYLVAAAASAGIALALHPLLQADSPGLALGAVVFRTIEATFYAVAVVGLLTLMPLARQLEVVPTASYPTIQTVADSLLAVRDNATLAGVFAFCLGAMLYYLAFYRSRIVPRWLSGWGIAGVALMLTACLLAVFSGSPVTGYGLLILPIAVQEMVLAVWLLAKGADSSPAARRAGASATV